MTITYFAFDGRAGPLRLAAYLGGLTYRDNFTTFEKHGAAKAAGQRRWSGLPEVTLHDKLGNDVLALGQSNVILRVIGTLSGKLYPKDLVQSLLVDELMNGVEDMFPIVIPYFLEQDADKKKEMAAEAVSDSKLPYWLNKFELRLTENEARGNKTGFFVGDSMTVADIKYYSALVFIAGLEDFDVDALLKNCPKSAAFWEMMQANVGVKNFNATFKAQQAKSAADASATEHIVEGNKNTYIAV